MLEEYKAMLTKCKWRIEDYLDRKCNESRLEALLKEIESLLKK